MSDTEKPEVALPMLLYCPECGARHIDKGDFATLLHHTHACQYCGHVWRPAVFATVGVQFLPGFRDLGVADPLDLTKEMPANYDPEDMAKTLIRDIKYATSCSPHVVQRLAQELLNALEKLKELTEPSEGR